MDKLTQDVRLGSWSSIVERCESRPEGQTKKEWLGLNGISEKQYYYWLRKIRRLAADNTAILPAQTTPAPVQFAEIPLSQSEMGPHPFQHPAVAVMIKTEHAVIQISDSASVALADRVMKAVSHAL